MLNLVIAGFLQGILEWFPVSSEGLVTLFLQNSGYTLEQAVDIALFLHIGTLVATVNYFWKDLTRILKPKSGKDVKTLVFLLWTTFLSLLVATPLYLLINVISTNYGNQVGLIIGSLLILTGVIQLFRKNFGNKQDKDVKKSDGVITGLAQGFAVLPGISRSGSTTLALVIQGFNIKTALKLSFLVSIPVIFIAQLVSGIKNGFFSDPNYLIAGLTAFIIGRFSIHYLLKMAEKINFSAFCIVFGIITIFF